MVGGTVGTREAQTTTPERRALEARGLPWRLERCRARLSHSLYVHPRPRRRGRTARHRASMQAAAFRATHDARETKIPTPRRPSQGSRPSEERMGGAAYAMHGAPAAHDGPQHTTRPQHSAHTQHSTHTQHSSHTQHTSHTSRTLAPGRAPPLRRQLSAELVQLDEGWPTGRSPGWPGTPAATPCRSPPCAAPSRAAGPCSGPSQPAYTSATEKSHRVSHAQAKFCTSGDVPCDGWGPRARQAACGHRRACHVD